MVTIRNVMLLLLGVIGMGHCYIVDMKRLNSQQVEAMQALKDLMEKEELEVEPYMWENYSLAKWLHYHGFNVEATCEAIKRTIQWRLEENIANILKEDWSDMRERFPYTRDTCDKDGRPILHVDAGKWDTSGYLMQGKEAQDRYFRYVVMIAEETEAVVWEYCKAGKYVVQGTIIMNLSGFSTLKHACLSCLQLYRKTSILLGAHYPNTRSHIMMLGTPLLFRGIYWVLTPTTQNHLLLIGHDRNQWESALLERIDPDQIPQGLLEYFPPGKQLGSPSSPSSSSSNPQYTNYGTIKQQRSTTLADIPYPFSLPVPTYGRIWKREL